jgi:hypothetical protein
MLIAIFLIAAATITATFGARRRRQRRRANPAFQPKKSRLTVAAEVLGIVGGLLAIIAFLQGFD